MLNELSYKNALIDASWLDYNVHFDLEVSEGEDDAVCDIRRDTGMFCTPDSEGYKYPDWR